MKKVFTFVVPALLCGSFAAAQQIGCEATTSSIVGTYAYVATEVGLGGVITTPPGTTSNTQAYSNTAIGKLVGNINGGGPFSTAGVLYFDGAGNISVASSSASIAPFTNVGSYTVNTDCTVNVTVTDVFNTTTSGPGVTNPTFGGTQLIGLVLGGGSEIDLSAPQSATSTNGNKPVVAGEFASRLTIQLIRSFSYGCSATSLTGAYGLVGMGFATSTSTTTGTGTGTGTSTTTVQPASFLARLRFDGNGNILADTVSGTSPLGSFQFTGTYTVNLDCSGSMTLNLASGTTTGTGTGTGTTTGTTTATTPMTVSFVIVPASTYLTNGSSVVSGNASRPSLRFTLSNSFEMLSGYGLAQ